MADERDTFKFDVEINTKKAFRAADDLKKLIRDVEKEQARASKNAGVISENALLEQKKRYIDLSRQVEKYEATLKKAQSINGLDRQARELAKALDTVKASTRQTVDGQIITSKGPQQRAAEAINKSANSEYKSNNSSFGQYKRWNQANPKFSNDRTLIRDYKKMTSDLKATVRQQGTITNRAESRNHITDTDQRQFKANRHYIENDAWYQLKDASRTKDAIQGQREETKSKLKFQQSANSGATREEINETKTKLEYLNKENKSVLEFIETMDSAVKTMGVFNRDMKQASDNPKFSTDPAKGSFLDKLQSRSFAIAANTVNNVTSAVKQRYQQGREVFNTEGTQAMNLGSQLNSDANDKTMLSRVQRTGTKYGLTTQDSLAYYSMAESRSGDSTKKGFESQTTKLSDSYAKNQRRSGLDDDNYKELMSAIQGANGISKSSDVSSIVNQVLAANQMSGNSGNYQQFAQTMTTMIAKISSGTAMNKNETRTVAATQSSLSNLGKSWQGESGKNAVNNLNSGFIDASNQQNAGLVFLKMQQMGQGGATGRQNALLSLQKGLSDKSNIDLLRQNVSRLGTAQGMQFAEQNFNESPEQAKELVEGIQNGTLSDKEIQKRYANKSGRKKGDKNEEKYNRSLTGTIKKVDSKKERNNTDILSHVGSVFEGARSLIETNAAVALGGTVIGGLAGGLLNGGIASLGSAAIRGAGKYLIPKRFRPNAKSIYEGINKPGSGGGMFSKIKDVASKFRAGGAETAEGASGVNMGKGYKTNIFSRFKSAFGSADDVAKATTKGADAASTATKVAGDVAKDGKGLSLLGKAGKGLGKIAIPLGLLSSGATILTAKDKGKAAAGEVGSWGGAIAGAEGGATLGTAIGGPIGTAVGGVIGAVGGGIFGEKAVKGVYDPIKKGATSIWNNLTGKDDDNKSSKSKSHSRAKDKTSQQATGGYLSYREQNSLLTKEKDIVNERMKFVKEYNKLLTKESNKGSSSSKKKNSKHANGGVIQNETTYVAEGNKAEVVVPTDPAKKGRTKALVNQVASMTGVRATGANGGGSKVVNQGSFSPTVNINVSGNADQGTVDAMAAKVKDALNSATNNYKKNLSYSW